MALFMLLVENTTKDKNESKQLLKVQPLELKLTFASEKQSSYAISLTNVSDNDHVAFEASTNTLPINCYLYPKRGLIKPKLTCILTVIIEAQSSYLDYMRCNHKFLIQSRIAPFHTSQDNVTTEMFADDSVRYVEEHTLWVVPVPPYSLVYSGALNFSNNNAILRAILRAKLDVLQTGFYPSKEERCTTTANSISAMPLCEFARVYGWKILFPWSVISISSMSALLYLYLFNHLRQ